MESWEFGQAVRRWRDRAAPETAGVPAELWESGEVGSPQDRSRHKIIDHPDVGLIALDCDALIVAGDHLRITVYTAEPGTEDAERLALAIVLGTQALID